MAQNAKNIAGRIRSAQGWLGLGAVTEAFRELEAIPSSACNLTVLRLRYTAFMMSKQWTLALLVAEVAVQLYERAAEPWLCRAEAIRMTTGSTEAARAALLPALKLFPRNKSVKNALRRYAHKAPSAA